MNRTLRALMLALLAVMLVVSNPPAQAVGTEDYPLIVSPSGNVRDGYTGPITVDFSNARFDLYSVSVDCSNGYNEARGFDYDGSQTTLRWTIPAMSGPDNCAVDVWSEESGTAYQNFHVNAPPPAMNVTDPSLAPDPFYPLVRDGYRDGTTMRYRLNQRANVVATVTNNSTGNRVRLATVGWESSGMQSWTWNGRNKNGNVVGRGRYMINITATSSAGSRDAVQRAVTATTSTITKRGSKSRWGDKGKAATRGDCRITRDSYEGSATVDCWGGRLAQMAYWFALPANATNVRWSVDGRTSYLDMCCIGRITRSASRTSSTHAVIRVQVTGWRAYDIFKARVTYKYTRRI